MLPISLKNDGRKRGMWKCRNGSLYHFDPFHFLGAVCEDPWFIVFVAGGVHKTQV